MDTETPPKQTRRRQGRALYVAIDPELRAFVDRESVRTRETRTAIVEEALRHLYVDRHQNELVRETLPDLRQVVRAELGAQLDELDRELKAQVHGLETRLGNRFAGLLVKAIRQSYLAHDLAAQAFARAHMAHYLTYNLAAEQFGDEVASAWDQDATAAAAEASVERERAASERAGHFLRDKAPADDASEHTA